MTTLDDIHNTWDHQLPPAVDDDEYTTRYRWLITIGHLRPVVAAVLADDAVYWQSRLSASPEIHQLSPRTPQDPGGGMVT